jgi:syntaxin 5
MPRDRTPEFRATLSSIRNRTRSSISPVNNAHPISGNDGKQRLLANGDGKGGAGSQKSEFARMAGQISRDLTLTMSKLQKLAQRKFDGKHALAEDPAKSGILRETVAKRKTLFDDRPVEISELTYIIRQDISSLNSQIAQLQSYVISQKNQAQSSSSSGKKGVVEEHNNNVVMMLQSRLASVGVGFKDVLELRTQVSALVKSLD